MTGVEEMPTPPRQARVRLWQVAVLGIAMLVFAAAVGFFVSARSDRDDAVAGRRRADAALTEARKRVSEVKSQLHFEHTEALQRAELSDSVLQSVQHVTDLTNQLADSAVTIEQLGAADQVYSDAFRAALDHANQLVQQYDATINDLRGLDPNGQGSTTTN